MKLDTISGDDSFWNFYWENRLQPMENLGKRAAILAISRLIRLMSQQANHPLRLLELGCGEGQVIGSLLDAHSQECSSKASVGVDYNARLLSLCKQNYADLQCVEGDFTDLNLLAGLGKFDLVILVNALHEVFSAGFSSELGEIDIPRAKLQVERALAGAAACLGTGGILVLFDGLEMPGSPDQLLRIRFLDSQVRQDFDKFTKQYHPFKIVGHRVDDPLCIELSRRDFTRYITKSIFLRKHLWETERFESYQYFTEEEFRLAYSRLGLEMISLDILTVNEDKWRSMVEIETPGASFPDEHILILAKNIQD